jgi:prepilin-type N-terminal cleavage/methylation domain-containing protein
MDETPAVNRFRREDGFSLPEVLSVLVILGLLAAIAIPNISRMVDRGREGAVVSDLRVAALFMQVYRSENSAYHADGLIPFSPTSPGVTITAERADPDGYCLLGVHEALEDSRAYTNLGLLEPGSNCDAYVPPGGWAPESEEDGAPDDGGGGNGNAGQGNGGNGGQGNGGQGNGGQGNGGQGGNG